MAETLYYTKLYSKVEQNITNEQITQNFAWASRENLRQKIVGKEIFFVVDYAPNNDRCYATAYLGTTSEGENLAEFQVATGMAEVRKVTFREDKFVCSSE